MMNFGALCSLGSVVTVVFGLAFLLAPTVTLALYGLVSSEPGLALMGRFFGVAMLANGLVLWALRPMTDVAVQRAFGLAQSTACVVGVLVSAYATLGGTMNGVGWSAVATYVFFAIAWGLQVMGSAGTAGRLAH